MEISKEVNKMHTYYLFMSFLQRTYNCALAIRPQSSECYLNGIRHNPSKTQYYALMRYIQFPKTSFSTLMLFKSFEKQANISPFSTLNSIGSASDQDLPQDNFQLARAKPCLTGREEAELKGRSILAWLATKGVCSGYPELLMEEFNELKIKKVMSLREKTTNKPPSLLERRLSKKLVINA